MAESFSDIMKQYDDASISDVGNALLARKEQVQSEQRKRDKKDARTQQVLAVLLAGQGLFKNAFKRRQAELQNAQTLDLLNAESDALNIRNISSVLSMVPEDFTKQTNPLTNKPYTVEENVNRYFSDQENSQAFIDKVDPILTTHLNFINQEDLKQSNSREYDIIKEVAARAIFENLITDDKHITFMDELKKMPDFQGLTREELLSRGISLTDKKLDLYKRQQYAALEKELRRKSGVASLFNPSTYANIFKRAGDDYEELGELNVFKRLTPENLSPAKISDIVDNINFQGIVVTSMDKGLKKVRQSPERFLNQMNRPIYDNYRKALIEEILPSLVLKIDRKKAFNKFGLQSYLGRGLADDLQKVLGPNTNAGSQFSKRTGALSLRLKSDTDFAVALYQNANPNATAAQITAFKQAIRIDTFRDEFSALLVLKAGTDTGFFGTEQSFIGVENVGEFTFKGELVDTPLSAIGLGKIDEYTNNFKTDMGYNPQLASDRVDPYITPMFNLKTGEATEDYVKLSKQGKDNAYYMMVQQIMNAPNQTDQARLQKLEEFHNVTPNPLEMPLMDYLQFKEQEVERDTQIQQISDSRYLSPKQLQMYKINLRRIEILKNDIKNEVVSSRDITGKRQVDEASPRDIENMQGRISRIEQSNQQLLANPLGAVNITNKIRGLDNQIASFQRRMPVLERNLPPTSLAKQKQRLKNLIQQREALQLQFDEFGLEQQRERTAELLDIEFADKETPEASTENVFDDEEVNLRGEEVTVPRGEVLPDPEPVEPDVTTGLEKKNLLKTREVGENVTQQAINAVVNVQGASDSVKNASKQFLMEVAKVESDFGENNNTFKNPNSNATGIFQIRPDQAFKEVQDVLNNKEAKRGEPIRQYNELLKKELGIDLSTATVEDLEKPLYSAAFSRAYFMRAAAAIPTDPVAKANYWFDNYVQNDKPETRDTFVIQYLRKNGYFIEAIKYSTRQAGKSLLNRD
tara:strand:+ start:2184 stop:5117 length:2934 start_codon:yes stop_codon:yes gene_type:complete